MTNMDVIIAGFGTVGQGIAEVIHQKQDLFQKNFSQKVKVVGVFDTSSYDYSKEGLDPNQLVQRKLTTGRVGTKNREGDINDFIWSSSYDVLIETTPTNIQDAEPAFGYMMSALMTGRSVVTSNKGPLALRFKELTRTAEKYHAQLRYEASVGGAMPVINLSKEILKGERIYSVRGILNGTSNFILHRMREEGLPFDQALREAQEIGIAEADPSYDIDGVDSACKLAILANSIFDMEVTVKDIARTGIRGMTEEAVALAAEQKKVIRLIASISDSKLEVAPRMVPVGHPLSIGGTLNIVQLLTDLAGDITIAGRGAGKKETASAILSDLVALMQEQKTKGFRY